MQSDRFLRHLGAACVIALVGYAVFYSTIEHRRSRSGPWQVTFTNDPSGAPAILVNEPKLAITNLQIIFPGEAPPHADLLCTMAFDQPRQVPYDVSFGKCLFMDTTFLPGTIVLELFGHEIQLIPRVLTIDKQEQVWRSGANITLPATNLSRQSFAPTGERQDRLAAFARANGSCL